MGQIEVYEWLKLQRQGGDHHYFSVREIERGIHDCGLFEENGRNIWGAVVTLESYGYLDVRLQGKLRNFRRVVRLKKKYIKKFNMENKCLAETPTTKVILRYDDDNMKN